MDVFPFLVGCPRSGTTLLRVVFDSHPDLAIPGESHFVDEMVRSPGRYVSASDLDVNAFVSDLYARSRFRNWGLDAADVEAGLRRAGPRSVQDAIRCVYSLYASEQGKRLYGDKTPRYVSELTLLGSAFPEARFIHIIRDGRDVALSIQDRGWKSVPSILDAALLWKKRVTDGLDQGRELGADRYTEVRYEDLVTRPEEVVRSLCSFLGLDFDERMLRFSERADEALASTRNPHAHLKLYQGFTPGLREWRSQMTRKDQRTFESVAGGLLSELGYETTEPRSLHALRAFNIAKASLGRIARRARRIGGATGAVGDSA